MEPRMSCRQSRQSKETDSVNCATSALISRAKRPLREMGDFFFHALIFELPMTTDFEMRRQNSIIKTKQNLNPARFEPINEAGDLD